MDRNAEIVQKNKADWNAYSAQYMAYNVKNEDVISGNMPSREEIDRMYTLENNPGMALPEMMCVVSRKWDALGSNKQPSGNRTGGCWTFWRSRGEVKGMLSVSEAKRAHRAS